MDTIVIDVQFFAISLYKVKYLYAITVQKLAPGYALHGSTNELCH